MKIQELLLDLVKISQKAADLARAIRSEQALFSLLVEEKTGDAKNKRFVEDFKTLADVLVQEVAVHDLGKKYPDLVSRIHGEESNTFTNTQGESVTVSVQDTEENTTALLKRVLGGDQTAASLLSSLVHSQARDTHLPDQLTSTHEVDQDSLALWIDPIDSTAQYISGLVGAGRAIHEEGLQCVVVLIGVYDVRTGRPLAGVINQPFTVMDPTTNVWSGRYSVGCCIDDCIASHLSSPVPLAPLSPNTDILLSSSESPHIKQQLSSEYNLIYAAGAGYKILSVIDNLAAAYVLSKDSTFKWDTCSPHAVLLSLGGGVLDLQKALDVYKASGANSVLSDCQLVYNSPDKPTEGAVSWCNSGGVLAYKDPNVALNILKLLCKEA